MPLGSFLIIHTFVKGWSPLASHAAFVECSGALIILYVSNYILAYVSSERLSFTVPMDRQIYRRIYSLNLEQLFSIFNLFNFIKVVTLSYSFDGLYRITNICLLISYSMISYYGNTLTHSF